MRISDWSSDVCSSDLDVAEAARFAVAVVVDRPGLRLGAVVVGQFEHAALARQPLAAILVAVGHVVQFGQHEEVQRELRLLEIHLACQRETEHAGRSEEHTSELQSLMRISYAVFCLKKKLKKNRSMTYT